MTDPKPAATRSTPVPVRSTPVPVQSAPVLSGPAPVPPTFGAASTTSASTAPAASPLAPVRLVVCLRTLAALDALEATLAAACAEDACPRTSILLRTTDPRDVLQFLDRPNYGKNAPSPEIRLDCAFLLDATLDAPGSGITLADHIREHSVDVPILFVTDHLEYVLIAFRTQPVDFLPRPVAATRLAECLRDVARIQVVRVEEARLRRLKDQDPTKAALPPGHRRKGDSRPGDRSVTWTDTTTPIALRARGTTYRIAAGEILFIERCKTETTIHLASRRIDCTLPLSWFQERLEPTELFVRCHKSFLVNKRHILLIDIKSHTLNLSYGHRCDIGRTFRKAMSEFSDPHVVRSARPTATATPSKGGAF